MGMKFDYQTHEPHSCYCISAPHYWLNGRIDSHRLDRNSQKMFLRIPP